MMEISLALHILAVAIMVALEANFNNKLTGEVYDNETDNIRD